jgi:hypothetical protein
MYSALTFVGSFLGGPSAAALRSVGDGGLFQVSSIMALIALYLRGKRQGWLDSLEGP